MSASDKTTSEKTAAQPSPSASAKPSQGARTATAAQTPPRTSVSAGSASAAKTQAAQPSASVPAAPAPRAQEKVSPSAQTKTPPENPVQKSAPPATERHAQKGAAPAPRVQEKPSPSAQTKPSPENSAQKGAAGGGEPPAPRKRSSRFARWLSSGKQSVKLAIAAVAVVFIGLGVLSGIKLASKPKAQYEIDGEAVAGLVHDNASEQQIQQKLDETAKAGTFSVSINPTITVGADKIGDVRIENIPDNKFGMQTDIIVTDANGVEITVYSSGVLKPGFSIEKAEFKVMPPAGSADAVAVIHAIDLETGRDQGSTSINIILTTEGTA